MQPQIGVRNNLWATQQSGLYAPKRMNFPIDPTLKMYMPLGHPELSGASIVAKYPLGASVITGDVTGTVHNPPISRVLDGDDYIDLGTPASLQMGTGIITVQVWVKFILATDTYLIFYGGAVAGSKGYGLGIRDARRRIRYEVYGTTGGRQQFDVAGSVGENTWTLVTAIFDGVNNKMLCYYNTSLEDDQSIDDPGTVTNAGNFFIGSHAGSLYFYKGSIGEVWVYYSTVAGLSLVDITHIHNATKWRYV